MMTTAASRSFLLSSSFMLITLWAMVDIPSSAAFVVQSSRSTQLLTSSAMVPLDARAAKKKDVPSNKMTADRRRKLGIADDEDEYDLEMALDNNTDPIITKIIAGSLIVSILALLVYGVVIPATADYGDGVCNPLLTGGRC